MAASPVQVFIPGEDNRNEIDEETFVSYDDETVLWTGYPSQWLNLSHFLLWGFIGAMGPGLLVYWFFFGGLDRFSVFEPIVMPLATGIAVFAFSMGLIHWIKLSCQKITITQNKITMSQGITVIFRSERYCELSDVIDIEAPAAGFLGLLGRGSLVLRTNDSDQPEIEIKAIQEREQLRDSLMPLIRRLRVERNANLISRRTGNEA